MQLAICAVARRAFHELIISFTHVFIMSILACINYYACKVIWMCYAFQISCVCNIKPKQFKHISQICLGGLGRFQGGKGAKATLRQSQGIPKWPKIRGQALASHQLTLYSVVDIWAFACISVLWSIYAMQDFIWPLLHVWQGLVGASASLWSSFGPYTWCTASQCLHGTFKPPVTQSSNFDVLPLTSVL